MEKTTLFILLVGLGALACCHAGKGDDDSDDSDGGLDECFLSCSDEYRPICGSDGRTYDNGCKLREAICRNSDLTVEHKGACVEEDPCYSRICTLECNPVCGSDGKTYGNPCSFDFVKLCDNPSLEIDHPGECEDPCDLRICTLEYNPICGSDGKTYGNPCSFDLAKLCDNPALEIDHFGECGEEDSCDSRICTLEYNPICGSDGETYGNPCIFNFAQLCDNPALEIHHPGECDPCALVLCAPLECDQGFIIDFDGEGCCPGRCVPDCSAVLCLVPDCPEDSQIVNPEQPCCRICETEPDQCEPQACILLYDPICGSDGETYGNECQFDFAKRCNNPDLVIDHRGECEEDPCDALRVCTLEYNPICGSNGITYGNKCQFDAARECIGPSLTILKYGRCDIPEECVDCALVDVICTDEKRSLNCDCRSDEVCCDDCCGGKVCQPRNDEKEGTCPPRQLRPCILGGSDDVPGCDSDADCKGRQKCCPGVCNSICQDPVEDDPCRDIFCDIPVCSAGWALDYDGPGCCPACIDCRTVLCHRPVCPIGSEIVDPEEGCCPVCSEIDPCRDIVCDPPVCPAGWALSNGGPSCCPSCIDCRLVRCALPVCPVGSEIVDPEEGCCPVCSEIVKDGTCPPAQRRACILGGPDDVPGCESDADCKGRQKCCPGVCRSICQDPVEVSSCPDGSDLVYCKVRPCQVVECEAYPDATCVDNYCGGCNADFHVDGQLVDCSDPLCPDGSNPVYCFVRPCRFAICEAYPDATCADNYCGGCIDDWYVDGELVDCNVCSLPLESGPCLAAFRRWGFRNGRCEEFTYGGCAGNANNFQTLSECADTCGGGCPDGSTPVNCLVSPCETATCTAFPEADCVDNFCGGCNADWFEDGEKVDCDSDVCSLPIVPGPCRGYFPSWGFQNGRCEEFTYGGCQGNGNRFSTEEECMEECGQNVCGLPIETGPCDAYFPSWGFQNGRCERFIYGGCRGNGNRFSTEAECVEECGQSGCPDGSTPVNCLVSPCETATCAAFPEADCVDNFCGGCNADWFVDGEKVDCDSDVCSLPIVPGPCRGSFPRWGFQNGRCEEFIYGGCQGNGNRFSTEEECMEECRPNVCSLPIEPGPCEAYAPSWGFQNGRCEKFIYGGCQGNGNRFSTEAECVEECGQGVCSLPIEPGPCRGSFPRWGFQNGRCEEFIYGGCQGNGNRFLTEEDCVDECRPNVCSLPIVPGPCKAYFPSWGFQNGRCEKFIYGGCEGNANRFLTEAECVEECGQSVCSLPIEPGTCKGYFPRWGFQNGRCEKFIYGGCHGNANNFPTKADCVSACDVCQLPLVTGPCEAVIPRWGFRDDECVEFTYGGCEGNDNNFKSLADCINECGPN